MKEIKVNFVLKNGSVETIDVPIYNTLMEATKYYSKNGLSFPLGNVDNFTVGYNSSIDCEN